MRSGGVFRKRRDGVVGIGAHRVKQRTDRQHDRSGDRGHRADLREQRGRAHHAAFL
jgi:hypothetical protein